MCSWSVRRNYLGVHPLQNLKPFDGTPVCPNRFLEDHEAVGTRVRTKYEQRVGPEERLVVIRSVEERPRAWYTLSDAPLDVPLEDTVRVHAERHRIEQTLEEAKAGGPVPPGPGRP